MAYKKKEREAMGRLSLEMHDLLNKAKREGRGLNSQERVAYHRMTDEFSKLELEVLNEHKDGIMARLAQPDTGGGYRPRIAEAVTQEELQDTFRLSRHDHRQRTPHDMAFTKYLRLTEAGLAPDELSLVATCGGKFRNAGSTTVGSQGGYTVPQAFSDRLQQALKWWGGIDGVVETFTTDTGAVLPYPTVDDTMNKGRILGENNPAAETDLSFGQVQFNAYIFSSDLVLISRALVEDSYFDLDALIAQMLGTRIGRLLNQTCTTGTGSSQPRGIVTAAVAAGNVLTLGTGNTTSFAYTNLVNLESAVDPAYRYNPGTRWMMPDASLKVLKLMVDGQSRPLWQPGVSASFREGAAVDLVASKPTILDHPYVINQDMAAPAANAYSMLFGDMSLYKLRRVGDVQVQRLVERYAEYLQIGFMGWLRADGQYVNANSLSAGSGIAVLQQSAS